MVMDRPNFIILNGFAGSGKTTVGKRYISEHPLALLIEGDELIINMGQWLNHEAEARSLIFELTKSLAKTHLTQRHDVVLPYLVVDSSHIDSFRQIAEEQGANFFNFLLFNQKEEAIGRLLERGTWGEAGLDPLSKKDLPEITQLYDNMEAALEKQQNVIKINQTGRSPDNTYELILQSILGSSTPA